MILAKLSNYYPIFKILDNFNFLGSRIKTPFESLQKFLHLGIPDLIALLTISFEVNLFGNIVCQTRQVLVRL